MDVHEIVADAGWQVRPLCGSNPAMSVPRLTLRTVEIRSVSIPLKRPVVSKVGRFDRWPLVLDDLHTEEGIVGRSYLEPYLERSVRYLVPAISDLAGARRAEPDRARGRVDDRGIGARHGRLGRAG